MRMNYLLAERVPPGEESPADVYWPPKEHWRRRNAHGLNGRFGMERYPVRVAATGSFDEVMTVKRLLESPLLILYQSDGMP